jgi:hypothetical protein
MAGVRPGDVVIERERESVCVCENFPSRRLLATQLDTVRLVDT